MGLRPTVEIHLLIRVRFWIWMVFTSVQTHHLSIITDRWHDLTITVNIISVLSLIDGMT